MNSRLLVAMLAWLLALSLAGCGGGASESRDRGTTSGGDDRDAPKWQIDYSGDLSGHIEGKSLILIRTGPPQHLNFTVRTIRQNPGLTATLSLREDKSFGFLTGVTLEDGTACTPIDSSDVTILDPSKETFHATVKGRMKCGEAEDQTIDFAAVIQDR